MPGNEVDKMKLKGNIKLGVLIVALLITSVFLGIYTDDKNTNRLGEVEALVDTESSIIEQKSIKQLTTPTKIHKLYYKDQLIGVIHDDETLDQKLNEVYEREYKEEFKDTKLGFIDDVYISEGLSYQQLEDKDEEIFDYVYEKELIAINVPKIEFSNGDVIFVKKKEYFTKATDLFIKNYVSEKTFNTIKNNEKIPRLKRYGEQELSFKVDESVIISNGYASIKNVLLDETEVLNYLSFGRNPTYKSYIVQEYDMIDGIAFMNKLSINQLITLNKDIIKDTNQIIPPGTKLNVTEINSPFIVEVTKERRVEELISPSEPIYQKDPNLRAGLTKVLVKEENGLQDALYEDVYENDVPIKSTLVTTKVTKQPVRGVIAVGSYVEPKSGSGRFIWPMSNARVTCGWGCYRGHRAVDFQSRSNRGYGPIYAIDRGVVQKSGYHSAKGYFIEINHNNGFVSEYFHMNAPGYLPVGATVRKGEQIGYVGMTGRTTGPHVHLVLRRNGSPVNPCSYLGC